ncbi:MAG: hypothetical protein QUS08_09300, partial [Methanothrix sp.]|nr:hypothetical protein [Methanothrix sp.]
RLPVGAAAEFRIEADLLDGTGDLWINDTVHSGLIYEQDSLRLQGAILRRQVSSEGTDGSTKICWLLRPSAPRIDIEYTCRLANGPDVQDGSIIPGGMAHMVWASGTEEDSDGAGDLVVIEPDLVLEISPSSGFVGEGDEMTITLALHHSPQSHAPAFDVDLRCLLPAGMSYVPGTARVLSGPQAGTDAGPEWHFPCIDTEWKEDRRVLVSLNVTSLTDPGQRIESSATVVWTSLEGGPPWERTGSGGVNDYHRKASCSLEAMGLGISVLAEPDPAKAGGMLTYLLTYENEGRVPAREVEVSDMLDPSLSLLSSDPAPSGAGTGGLLVWRIPQLNPDGPHRIAIKAKVGGTLEDGALLKNSFSIRSEEVGPRSGTVYTRVTNDTRLLVNKTALQSAVRRGEEVGYIIQICNSGGRAATNLTVRDGFDSAVELLSAEPAPGEDGAWRLGHLDPGGCIEIRLTVRVPRIELLLEESQDVRGEGFMRSYRGYTTGVEPSVLTNRVTVTSDQMKASAAASVRLLGERGTDLHLRSHGSGGYESRERLLLLTENRSIELGRGMSAYHHPVALLLPGERSLSISSRFSEEIRARNGLTNTTFLSLYRRLTRLDGSLHLHLDENGTLMESSSDFQGEAQLEVKTLDG